MGCALAAGDVGVLPELFRSPLLSVGKGLSFEVITRELEKTKKTIIVEIIEDRISPLVCLLRSQCWRGAVPGLLYSQSSSVSPVYFRHGGDKDDANCKRNYLTALYYV